MKISMYTMAVDSFVPMLQGLSGILDKGAAYASANKLDLVNARLAPDMFPLAQQVRLACHHANDCVLRLTGKPPQPVPEEQKTLEDMRRQIAATSNNVKGADPEAFAGAEDRDCSISIPNNMVIAMNGMQLLRSWSLPNFYFHLMTAYGILRNSGVAIGKQDYLTQLSSLIRPAS
jgi:hypothetical protein